MTELLNHTAQLWWSWMAAMFWQVSLLILLIGCIDAVIRRWAWPQLRYALWMLVALKLILPPAMSLPSSVAPKLWPLVTQTLTSVPGREPADAIPPVIVTSRDLVVPALLVQPRSLQPVEVKKVIPAAKGLVAAAADRPAAIVLGWQVYAMVVWLLGVLALGAWLFFRLRAFLSGCPQEGARPELPQSFYEQRARCAQRLGLRRPPRVVVTGRLYSPAVFGVFRPVLLMPRGYLSKLSRKDTEHLLLHEFAHIARGDLLVHSLYMLLQIIYWCNPLLWLVCRQMHHLRELCCDATVARLLRERTAEYRETLLETARRFLATRVEPGLGLLGLFEDSNRLQVRLDWLKKPTWRYRKMKTATVISVVVLMSACVLPMAGAGNTSASAEGPAPAATDRAESSEELRAVQEQLRQLQSEKKRLQEQLDQLAQRMAQLAAGRKELAPPPKRPAVMELYTVKAGDTLKSIAERFYGSGQGEPDEKIARIVKANRLDASGQIHVGQELRIPAPPLASGVGKRSVGIASSSSGPAVSPPSDAAAAQPTTPQEWQQWAKEMQAWAEQMRQWPQGDEMQKWQTEIEKWQNSKEFKQWQKEMEHWSKEQAKVHVETHGAADDSMPAPHPVPVMPRMPAPPVPITAPTSPVPSTVIVPKAEAPAPAPEVPVPSVRVPSLRPAEAVPADASDADRVEGRAEGEYIIKSFGPGTWLQVDNEVGSVSIRGGEQENCGVTVIVRAKGRTTEEAEEIAKQVLIRITPTDGKVLVRAHVPDGLDKEARDGINVEYRITVPRHANARVAQKVGDVHLSTLEGQVKAVVEVGTIRAEDLRGDALCHTKVGNIDFVVPRDISAQMDAQTKVGSIASDLPLKVTSAAVLRSGDVQSALGSSATGTLGTGKNKLNLSAEVGSIRIRSESSVPAEVGSP